MDKIFFYYMSYFHLIIFTFCFFVLEKLYRQKNICVIFYFLLSFIAVSIRTLFFTLEFLVMFILFFGFSYKVFPQKNSVQIVLSIMCSAMIELLFTSFYGMIIPCFLRLSGFSKSIMLILVCFLSLFICLIVSTVLRERVYPYLFRKNITSQTSFLLMAVILGYQIVEIIQRYTENRNLLFTLLIFYCLLSVLSITTVYALSQKKLLEEELNKHKVILELQEKYTNEIKKQYQETRKFRHDHANLLAAIRYYLENNEVAELKKFFFEDIMKSNEESKKKFFLLDELQNIGSLGVRGIFYTKLVSAQEKGIDIQIEITDFLSEEKKVRTSSLVRLFGIFLDNAIEELDSIQKGSLIIVGFEENNNSVFIIQNTIRDKIVPLQLLKKEGFSTRSKKRGLGLVNVEEILLAEPSILLETKITDDFFIQRITIVSEVE